MRPNPIVFFLAAALAGCAPAPPPAVPSDVLTSNDGSYRLTIEPPIADCVLGQPCSFVVMVERAGAGDLPARLQLEVDAAMPDHRHGLNARPTVRRRPEGGYSVEGLLLHMPGYWEVYLDLTQGAVTERAQVALER